jgi:hypothetical protein
MPRELFQFKVELVDIQPAIWRRVQIRATETFWALHCAVQDAMGWQDCHLHEFRIANGQRRVRIGIPDPDGDTDPPGYRASWEERLDDYFVEGVSWEYRYDFGDGWVHQLTPEKRLPAALRARYPRCVGGARACPPEDCGGTGGYQDFVEAVLTVSHPQHEEMLEWWGGPFDPDRFDARAVRFSSAKSRLALLFEN